MLAMLKDENFKKNFKKRHLFEKLKEKEIQVHTDVAVAKSLASSANSSFFGHLKQIFVHFLIFI